MNLKNLYARRFFWGTLVFGLVLGLYLDLRPLGEKFYLVLQEEKQSSLQLKAKEAASARAGQLSRQYQKTRLQKKQSSLLDDFLAAAREQHCGLKALQLEPRDDDNKNVELQNNLLQIRLALDCDFVALFHFLEEVRARNLPLLPKQLVLKVDEEKFTAALQLTAIPLSLWLADGHSFPYPRQASACCSKDPFASGSALDWELRTRRITEVPLGELRYVGSLQGAHGERALLALPNGELQEFSRGDKLGQEGWELLSWDEKQLKLQAPDKKQVKTLGRE